MKLQKTPTKPNKIYQLTSVLLLASNFSIAQSLIYSPGAVAGVVTLPDGSPCEGELREDKISSPGNCQYANGDRDEGQFVNGKPRLCFRCNESAYPISVRTQKREWEVDLVVNIGPDGNVLDVSLAKSSGRADLDQAAIDRVKNWKFSSTEGGVQGKIITVKFELNN